MKSVGWRRKFHAVGPGILFAGAAIGVSHLVQATRAGAGYGFDLLWAVILVLLFKYPFFQYSHRYTVATVLAFLTAPWWLGSISRWCAVETCPRICVRGVF